MAPKWSQVEAKLGYGNMVAFLTSFLTLYDPLWRPTWTLNWSQVGPKLDQNGYQFLLIFYIDFLIDFWSNLDATWLQKCSKFEVQMVSKRVSKSIKRIQQKPYKTSGFSRFLGCPERQDRSKIRSKRCLKSKLRNIQILY